MPANEEVNTYADFIRQASPQPAAEVVTLTGTLWQPSDPSKLGLSFAGHSTTFDIARVSSYLTLASSLGETIVRVDVDASGITPAILALANGGARNSANGEDGKPPKDPIGDTGDDDRPQPPEYGSDYPPYAACSSVTPFALATPRQAPSTW